MPVAPPPHTRQARRLFPRWVPSCPVPCALVARRRRAVRCAVRTGSTNPHSPLFLASLAPFFSSFPRVRPNKPLLPTALRAAADRQGVRQKAAGTETPAIPERQTRRWMGTSLSRRATTTLEQLQDFSHRLRPLLSNLARHRLDEIAPWWLDHRRDERLRNNTERPRNDLPKSIDIPYWTNAVCVLVSFRRRKRECPEELSSSRRLVGRIARRTPR